MRSEDRIFDALAAVMPTYHLAMDGEPDEAAIYSLTSRSYLYESDEPILRRDTYDVIIAQRQHDAARVDAIRSALIDAGFSVRTGAQSMTSYFDAGYSIDNMSASQSFEAKG